MSSHSHQNYSRIWANEVGVPIFSIDYRLSPLAAFPDALNDCWQVYYWLVLNAEKHLGIRPDQVVLVGDSAGGNFICALTILAIQKNFRVPDGLLICYGALQLSGEYFTPSLLFSIDDPILPFAFLKMCLTSYTGQKCTDPDFLKHL